MHGICKWIANNLDKQQINAVELVSNLTHGRIENKMYIEMNNLTVVKEIYIYYNRKQPRNNVKIFVYNLEIEMLNTYERLVRNPVGSYLSFILF